MMLIKRILLPIITMACLIWTPVFGADDFKDFSELNIEALLNVEVSGASSYLQKATEAPSAVTVINAEQIKKYGYRTFDEILRSARSFYTSYDRNYSYIGYRGFSRPGDYNTRILLIIDGHRMNDNLNDYIGVGTDFILDVDLIDRVEIIRGPGSSLYGSNALLAVINVITKSGKALKGAELSASGGSHDTYSGRFSYGNTFENGLEMLVSGSGYTSEGQSRLYYKEYDSPDTNNGITRSLDDDENDSFFAKLSYRDFTLEGAYVDRKKQLPTAPWDTIFNDPRDKSKDERGYIDLKYQHVIDTETSVMGRIFYDSYYYHGDYIYDYPPVTTNEDFSRGNTWGLEAQFKKQLFEKHTVVVGSEYRDNYKQDQGAQDIDPYYEYIDDKRDSKVWALFAQDEFRICDNLLLNAGLRYDHYDTFGGTTNPRLALIYQPVSATTIKLLYGRAFRAPNVYELYYDDGGVSQKGNPDLDPETIESYDAVVEHYFNKNLKATIDGFYYTMDDLIDQQTTADGLLKFSNTDGMEARGVELELDGIWENSWQGSISYTYTDAEDKDTDKTLTNSPKHLAKFNLIAPLVREKLFAGLEVQYTSGRKTLAGNTAHDFFITNLTLFSPRILKGLEVSGSIYNLFNQKYSVPGAGEHRQDTIEQDGTTFRIKMTYRF